MLSSTVTLRDIALKMGVSHATVSLSLKNSNSISSARRKEIQDAAVSMGYRPNAFAKALSHQRKTTQKGAVKTKIAWVNFWKNPYQLRSFREFDSYWKGAYLAAETHGYCLEEFACGEHTSPPELEKLLLSQNITGILLPPHGGIHYPSGLWQIDWAKFCTVRFGYSIAHPAAHVVASNYLRSGLLAVENICSLGYKKIGYVTMFDYGPLFRSGYCVSQSHQAKSELVPILYLAGRARADLSRWLQEHRPDAIITDFPELRGMLKSLGYRVPDDIGLAATSILDGNADAGIDQCSEEIGAEAVDTLIALLQRNDFGIPSTCREILITGNWVNGSTLPERRGSPCLVTETNSPAV